MSSPSAPLWIPAGSSVHKFPLNFVECFVCLPASTVMGIFDMDRKGFINLVSTHYSAAVTPATNLLGEPIPMRVEDAWPHNAFLAELHQDETKPSDPKNVTVKYLRMCFVQLRAANGASRYHFDCLVQLCNLTYSESLYPMVAERVRAMLVWRQPVVVARAPPAPAAVVPAPAVVAISESDKKKALNDATMARCLAEPKEKSTPLRKAELVRLAETDPEMAKKLEEKRLKRNARMSAYMRQRKEKKRAEQACQRGIVAAVDDREAVAALLTLSASDDHVAVAALLTLADPVVPADPLAPADPLVAGLAVMPPMPALRADGVLLF